MTKKVNTIVSILLFTGILLLSCSKQDNSENQDTTKENTETASEEAPVKENIPSPLKKISETINGVQVEMQYGSPGVKGRNIWGELVPYGEVWRTGANEATWISFDKDVMIADNKIPAGKYGLFTIPAEAEWTIILNKTWDQWGAYDYKQDDDVARFSVTPSMGDDTAERMTFAFAESKVNFMWDKLALSFEVASAP